MDDQKKKIALAVIAIVVAIGILSVSMKTMGDPAPTVQNLPDYSKMSGEQIAASREASMKAEQDALAGKR